MRTPWNTKARRPSSFRSRLIEPKIQRTSGILSLCSLCALMVHIVAVIPKMTPNMIAVFPFQFAGCAYQPPAGDQTCFGNPRLPSSSYSTRTAASNSSSCRRAVQYRPQWQCRQQLHSTSRLASADAVTASMELELLDGQAPLRSAPERKPFPAASESRARSSAKLAALHARLALPAKLPLSTLARCLIDASVDPRPGSNNASLTILGQELLGYYTAEWLICHYPRLPMPVLFAAQHAYVGNTTLANLRREWGVEAAVAPGLEVDAGLLQFTANQSWKEQMERQLSRAKGELTDTDSQPLGTGRSNEEWRYRRGISSRIVYDNEFGDLVEGRSIDNEPSPEGPSSSSMVQPVHRTLGNPTTVEAASANFIRALVGALYLHAGLQQTQKFHASHILSRHLQLHTLFNFTHPTRDLSRLCAREGFEPPVARLLSETGRHSRSPVFVVGVFSGEDKLGEGAGSSLNEARVRAAAAALRAWYLYSPPEDDVKVPSCMLGTGSGAIGQEETERKVKWRSQLVDVGEIIT
ncbi:ribonuclease III [Polychaeton citri CBS 116435]|uniref:Large ribosomal subunit protein mL44 n=1 Tax=Polychaeton citri CBS 116435 TaxID=1314669 RepID=A0A9P4US26_9PEZI|nr:ribonuclease III [Polychaeton citri CBS 116435]